MAEDIRRSGRATKGQYNKDRDIADENGTKRKDKGKSSKLKATQDVLAEENEEEYIRCICGQYEAEEETERTMICCDRCGAWQHNDCMGLPNDYAPPDYFCEVCEPGRHKKLLAAVKRGLKPWEEVARQREAAADAEKAAKKKRGKKGNRKPPSKPTEIHQATSQEVESSPISNKDGTASIGASGHKRKLEDPANGIDTHQESKKPRQTQSQPRTSSEVKDDGPPHPQKRKSSVVSVPSRQASRSELNQGALVSSVEELVNAQRKSAAGHLIKFFIDQSNDAVKQGVYNVPEGQTAKEVGTQLGLRVEHAMYHNLSTGSGEPNEAYKVQMRTIMFNVKKNAALRDRLLSGNLSPHRLAVMDPAQMASEEQQQKDAAVKQELERQHTIIQEQGPRIRKTHKGEEYVDEAHEVASESIVSHAPRRQSITELEVQTKSPEVTSPADRLPPKELKPLAVNTKARPRPSVDPQRKSSTNFNIHDVWSSVQGSPDSIQHSFAQFAQPQPPGAQQQAGPGTQADADIDALLKDEDNESEPYSPKAYVDDDEIVWRGSVNGGTIGKFNATANFAGGANPADMGLSWEQLIPPSIFIEGRIEPSKANEYLCGLQFSASSDLIMVVIRQPEDSNEQQGFNKLFNYFKDRNRYAVGVEHTNPAIKDIYLIPVGAGANKPEILQLMDNATIQNPVSENLLVVPFVVKNTELIGATPREAPLAASPLTAVQGRREGDFPAATPTPHSLVSLHTDGPAPPSSIEARSGHSPQTSPTPHPLDGTPSRQVATSPSAAPGQTQYQPTGAAAASQVLGASASAPAVQQLLEQVPTAGMAEMNVVKEIIQENAVAAQDLQVLTQMLMKRNQPKQ